MVDLWAVNRLMLSCVKSDRPDVIWMGERGLGFVGEAAGEKTAAFAFWVVWLILVAFGAVCLENSPPATPCDVSETGG